MYAKFRGDSGKAIPMTAVSPLRPYMTWLAVSVLWLLRWFPRRGRLKSLAFIHFARWVVLRRKDFRVLNDKQPVECLRHDYLLFSTNFNNHWEQYIDAFSLVLRLGVNLLWFTSRRFPGAWPIRLFKIYIRYNEYPTRYYYNAYPESSVRDVESALVLRSELLRFMQSTRDMDPDTFADEYGEFTRRIQMRLASATQRGPQFGDHPSVRWPAYRDRQPINLETL